MSPQGQLNTEARLQVVDSLFLDNAAVNGAGVFVQRWAPCSLFYNRTGIEQMIHGSGAVAASDTPSALSLVGNHVSLCPTRARSLIP